MNYCSNCGNKIENVKYCSNCGFEIRVNTKEASTNIIDKNINGFGNQIKESVVVNKSVNTLMSMLEKISDFLGVIGFVIIVGQIVLYLGKKEQLLYLQTYSEYKNSIYGNFLSDFIAVILPTTILPFLFMILLGLKKHWLLVVTLLSLLFFIVASQST